MQTQPSTQVAGEAQENSRTDVQLAAIKGTSEVATAFLQRPNATLEEAKELISHIGQTFSAFISMSPVPPQAARPGPRPGTRQTTSRGAGKGDVDKAQQALGAAIKEVAPKTNGTATEAKADDEKTATVAKKPPKGKTLTKPKKAKATKAAKKAAPKKAKKSKSLKRGKPSGQFAEIIEQFDDFEDASLTPMVAVKDSITPDAIICLHTGEGYTMMKSHLYHLGYRDTDEQTAGDRYREFWKLPEDYPLVAPSYSDRRKDIAKKTVTGRRPGAKTILERADKAENRHEYLVKTTVFPNYIISLIDGTMQKHLDLHVENNKMTWEDYLKKFDLPADYPKESASVSAGQNEMRERQGVEEKRTGTTG